MIYDTFENVGLYFEEGEQLRKAVKFAASFDASQPDGRYEIDGDALFANVMTYETKQAEALKFEGHRKYIDVQLLLSGEEFMDVSSGPSLDVDTPYAEEKDCELFHASECFTSVCLHPGAFAVVYPHDLHRPGRLVAQPAKVRKMVVKVKVGS